MASLLAALEAMGRIATVRKAAAVDRRTAVRNMVDICCVRRGVRNWCDSGRNQTRGGTDGMGVIGDGVDTRSKR